MRLGLPGRPDLVLPAYRAVIFVNGCFWHGHRGCPKYVQPKANADFWREKIARNIARDEINAQRLDTLAWTVITIWECELTKARLAGTVDRIETELAASKANWEDYCTRRRESRAFAIEQARLHLEHLALVEAELDLPKCLRRYEKKAEVEEL